jgi:hypothetical protein
MLRAGLVLRALRGEKFQESAWAAKLRHPTYLRNQQNLWLSDLIRDCGFGGFFYTDE